MTSTREQILANLKKAMLEKDEVTRDTLRMVKADLMNEEVKLGREPDEAETLAILQRGVKTRRDSIEQYRSNGREDAAVAEETEIAVIEAYLPKALSEDELQQAIDAKIRALGLTGKQDMGRLMKELKAELGPTLDGRTASKLAAQALAKL
ncbi:MAG: GatB/YqeY domain-containing protein [Myxococcota bacterium]